MSIDYCFRIMDNYPPCIAATKKYPNMPENFAWHYFSWVGDIHNTDTMQVSGQQYRMAKSGKSKGQICIPVPKTKYTVYINKSDIERETKIE